MPRALRRFPLWSCMLALSLPRGIAADERPLPKIAVTGESAGGTKDVFFTLDGAPVQNTAGDVAFRGGMAPASAGPAPALRRGIWKGAASTGLVEVIAADGDPAPGGAGLAFRGFSLPALLEDGRVLFLSSTDTDLILDALFVGTSHADLRRVVAASEMTSSRIDGFLANDLEQVFALTNTGLHYGTLGGTPFGPQVLLGEAAPGIGGATFSILNMPSLNFAGMTAFLAFLGGVPADGDQTLWFTGTDSTLLAREGAAAPARAANGNQLFFGGFSTEPSVNSSYRKAFLSPLTGGTLETQGIFHGDNAADLAPVAIRGTLAASSVGDVSFTSLFPPALGADGSVYFLAVASVRPPDPRPVPLRTVPSLWRSGGAGLQLVAGMAGAAPGTSQLLGRITSFAVEPGGRTAFTAELYEVASASSAGFGLWVEDAFGAFQLVVRTGDTVPISGTESRTVAGLADSILLLNPHRSLNDAQRRGPQEGVPTGFTAGGGGPLYRLQFTGGGPLGSFGLFGSAFGPAPPIVTQPVVNSMDDDADRDPGDGICDTGGTVGADPECTLRAALQECNEVPEINRVTFAIETEGIPTIFARSPLPQLSKAILIDATTQPGAGRVSIHGGSAGAGAHGLHVRSDGCELNGLTITAFNGHGVFSEATTLKLGSPDVSANRGDGIHASAGGVRVKGDFLLRGNDGDGLEAMGDVLLENSDIIYEASSNGQNGILAEGKVELTFGAIRADGNGRLRSGEECADDRAAGVSAGEVDVEGIQANSNCGSGIFADRRILLKTVILEDNTRHGARSFAGDITLTGDAQFVKRNGLNGLECTGGLADVTSQPVIEQNGGYGITAGDIKLGGTHAWIEENGQGGLRATGTITSTIPMEVNRNGSSLPPLTCADAPVGAVDAVLDIDIRDIVATGNCGSAIYTDLGNVRTGNATLTGNDQFGVRCPSGNVTLFGTEHTVSSNRLGGLWLGDGSVTIGGKAILHGNGTGRESSSCMNGREAAINTDGAVIADDLDLDDNCGSGVRCDSLNAHSVTSTDHDQFGIWVLGSEQVSLVGSEHAIARNGLDGIFAQHASVFLSGRTFITANGTRQESCQDEPPRRGGISTGGIIEGIEVVTRLNCGSGLIAGGGVLIDVLLAEQNTQYGVYSHGGVILPGSGHRLSRNGVDGLAAPEDFVTIDGSMEASSNGRNGLTVAGASIREGRICDNREVGIHLAGGGSAFLGNVEIRCGNGIAPVRTGRGTLVSPVGQDVRVGDAPNPSPGDAPAGQEFPAGFYEVSAGEGADGGGGGTGTPLSVEIVLELPAGFQPETYFNYGPTPDRPEPHWYEFIFDGTTGAQITAGQVLIRLVDGLRGDDDLVENGSIHSLGGPAVAATGGALQRAGDCNQDLSVDISDALCVLGFLFLGRPESLGCGDGTGEDAGNRAVLDWGQDGGINIVDAVSLLNFLFQGGPPHALVADPAEDCIPAPGCAPGAACN